MLGRGRRGWRGRRGSKLGGGRGREGVEQGGMGAGREEAERLYEYGCSSTLFEVEKYSRLPLERPCQDHSHAASSKPHMHLSYDDDSDKTRSFDGWSLPWQ